jgi:NodT family efflux transporter outer membrane factor (OMF) lipoprotein
VTALANRRWSAAVLAASLGLLGGCVVGPRYAAPKPPAPQAGNFVSDAPVIASADQPPPNWWKLYDDPAIDPLVQEALTHNTNLLAAAANLAQARAALSLARSNLLPSTTVSAGAQYGVSDDAQLASQLRGLGPAPAGWLYTAGLDASYEVDLFGRIRRTIQAAKADYEAQQAAEDISRISVAGETTRAYINACAYARELAVAQQSLALVTQTYEVTVKEAGDGAASDFDVARAREAVEQTRSTLPTFDVQRRTALFQLAVLTGKPPEEISKAADACAQPPKLAVALPVGDIQSLFRRRPDVRQAERQLAANVARIGVATADLYPTITLGASFATAATTPSGLGRAANNTYALGPLLSWAFPNTLAAQAEIRQARATASASYANFEGAVLQALQDTEAALTSYGDELNRNTALTAVFGQSQAAFKLAQDRFRLGSISYLDLLTAQNDLINANAALANSGQALASDQVTVFKALGGGWEQAPAVDPLPILDGRSGRAIKVK